ncbi:hypothetical protein D3C78_1712400 [compost metagenome]
MAVVVVTAHAHVVLLVRLELLTQSFGQLDEGVTTVTDVIDNQPGQSRLRLERNADAGSVDLAGLYITMLGTVGDASTANQAGQFFDLLHSTCVWRDQYHVFPRMSIQFGDDLW